MSESSEPEILTLNFKQEPKVAPRSQKIMSRPIKRVKIQFEDGEILDYQLDHQQGFYRETLTYEEAIDGSRQQHRLKIFNVFWTIKEPV